MNMSRITLNISAHKATFNGSHSELVHAKGIIDHFHKFTLIALIQLESISTLK